MNKEKRKQIVLDKKLSRVWQSYKDMKKDKQLELTNHSFSFHIDDIGAGWEYVHFKMDDQQHGFRISYIGPGVSDFVRYSTHLEKNETGTFSWYDEPGEYNWLLSRRDDMIYIEAPFCKNGFFLRYDYFKHQVIEGWKIGILRMYTNIKVIGEDE